ncbi:MAG: site-specific DNA-methyltransferase [Paludibacteraceae bacterium]|nr:site-specific DNA-methyltransferase [Paludibacteraceae bacterium]
MAQKIDRAALAQRIRELEGLSSDERSALLELLHTKKYGLVWENKPEDVEERLRENLPVLEEVTERHILSDAPDAPNHILIEGDNLEALTALTYTHEGKIDVIYIDPPYNTGNKDFVYNDAYVDSEDSYRHSKWLSFMHKRLKIAKRLLSDKGVIFISIDDNEQANLKLMCDEVFGLRNFVAEFIWKKKQGGGNDSGFVVTEHEYVLCIANNISKLVMGLDKSYVLDDKLYPFKDEKGEYGLVTLDKASIQISQSLIFDIIGPNGEKYYPRIVNGKQSCWRWSKAKVESQYDELVFKKGKVYTKYYRPKEGVTPKSLLIDAIYGRTESGNDDIKQIFGVKPFGYPKPILLIRHILSISSIEKDNSIILDFFAGSGTTLHATMQLNKEDGGHRQCILVTNNENNICEEVTYERAKRVIKGYNASLSSNEELYNKKLTLKDLKKANEFIEEMELAQQTASEDYDEVKSEFKDGVLKVIGSKKGEHFVDGLTENSLRYYRTKLLPRESSVTCMRNFMASSVDLLCIKNDLYEEQSNFGSIRLNSKYARYFANAEKQMLVIFNDMAIESLVEEIKKMSDNTHISVYVFSVNNYAMEADFEDVADKVSLCALPAAIYNAYLKVLPKKNHIENAKESESEAITNEEEGQL